MKKIMYVLIGVLVASLVYIMYLSDIPEKNIPENIITNEFDEVNDVNEIDYEDDYTDLQEIETEIFQGYRVDKSELTDDKIKIGKLDPMFFKKAISPINPINPAYTGTNPFDIPVSNNSGIPVQPLETGEPTQLIEPTKPEIVLETDNEEMKEVIENLDKDEIKKTFKAIDIHDFMKSFNKEENNKDEIEQIVELSYVCEKCGELFLLPLETNSINIPKVYGAERDLKYPIYTGMDITLKENEGFIVYSKSDMTIKSIEIETEDGCGTVVAENEENEIIYEHLSSINKELKVDGKVIEGQIIGEVKAKGSPKGINYNIKVDMGGYRVNSNVFIVTEEDDGE